LNVVFPSSETFYHGLSTNHDANSGKLNHAVIFPSVTSDGKNILCGAKWKGGKDTTKVIVWDIKNSTFKEEALEDVIKLFNFEASLPAIDLDELTLKLHSKYKFKTTPVAKANNEEVAYEMSILSPVEPVGESMVETVKGRKRKNVKKVISSCQR